MLSTVTRTPDEWFANLPGYPFEPHYSHVDRVRMQYVDERPRNGHFLREDRGPRLARVTLDFVARNPRERG